MGQQSTQLLAVAPFLSITLSGVVSVVVSRSNNLVINHSAPVSFTQRIGHDIKTRYLLLLYLSLFYLSILILSSTIAFFSPESPHGSIFILVPVLVGWIAALSALFGIVTHRVNSITALPPLQWFYSASAVVAIIDLWTHIDVIAERIYSTEIWVHLCDVAIVLALAVTSLTMPVELNLEIVHRYGYEYSSEKHSTSPEATASYISWLYFSWFSGVIKLGSTKTLQSSDLPELVPLLRARTIWIQFQVFSNMNSCLSLIRRIISFNALTIFWQFVFSIASSLLDFSIPYFLKLFLSNIKDPTSRPKDAYLYIILIFISQVSRSLVQSQTYYLGCKLAVSMTSLLNAEIYAKTLNRRDMSGAVQMKKDGGNNGDGGRESIPASLGKIVNIMSSDASRVAGMSNYWHIGVSSGVGIAIGGYLLYDLLGWSSFVGLSILVITFPITNAVNNLLNDIQGELSDARDERVTLTNELITGIRMIKFFAWENSFSEKVSKAREFELTRLVKSFKVVVLLQLIWFASPLLVTLSSFFCYAKLEDGVFTPAVAFTAIVLFERMKNPLNGLPSVYTALVHASVSLRRISEYLNEPNIEGSFDSESSGPESPEIGLKGLTAQWWTTGAAKTDPDASCSETTQSRIEDNERFALRNISVIFPTGELSVICGPTGCGKTSFLLAMLGEMDVLQGTICLPNRGPRCVDPGTGLIKNRVSYVSQQSWLQNASIRDNILFGSEYEEDRYSHVIEVCALKRDLEILEDGDMTEIGEKGVTLSGGQKQRISLARAVYSKAQYVLLDDCLSAVDAQTAKHIHSMCLIGSIMKGRTCILVTHHVQLCISTAKHIVLMGNGEIKAQGSILQLRNQGYLSHITDDDGNQGNSSTTIDDKTGKQDVAGKGKKGPRESGNEAKKLVQEEKREEGGVKLSIYLAYASAVGGILFWVIILSSYAVARSTEVSKSLWVREWANSYVDNSTISNSLSNSTLQDFETGFTSITDTQDFQEQFACHDPFRFNSTSEIFSAVTKPVKHSTDYYLMIYALISIATILTYVGQTVVDLYGAIRAARSLYKKLLFSVVHAPLRFFDTTPVGRIMNRFSGDFETVDDSISDHMCLFITYLVSILSVFILLTYITPLFIVVAVAITAAYLIVARMYVNTSRDLKRLHSTTRSPKFSKFGETLAGVTTIRAFNEQHRFMSDMLIMIDDSNRPFYCLWNANRWLSVRADTIGAIVALSSGIFILTSHNAIDEGSAGLALTYALEFVSLVNVLVRMYTEIEMDLSSIERIMEYTDMPLEPPAIIESHRPPAAWPTEGNIEVRNLEVKYAPDLETVLHGISFVIEPHQKIGVVGRTGSGKSSLALSLFRFVEPVEGSIFIDGINICDIGLEELRSRLTIIPQDPTLFSGTIRSNLDPFDDHLDSELWEVLKRVHLVRSEQEFGLTASNNTDSLLSSDDNAKPTTSSLLSLEAPVSEGGYNFSQGQRQLLCLARALLRNSKIVVMDEATSSVDFTTDRLIQSTIQQEFKNSTVICIAHRLNTIVNYDKVLVLDNGRILEFDTPANLLNHTNGKKSHFRELCGYSGELDTLMQAIHNNENFERSTF